MESPIITTVSMAVFGTVRTSAPTTTSPFSSDPIPIVGNGASRLAEDVDPEQPATVSATATRQTESERGNIKYILATANSFGLSLARDTRHI